MNSPLTDNVLYANDNYKIVIGVPLDPALAEKTLCYCVYNNMYGIREFETCIFPQAVAVAKDFNEQLKKQLEPEQAKSSVIPVVRAPVIKPH